MSKNKHKEQVAPEVAEPQQQEATSSEQTNPQTTESLELKIAELEQKVADLEDIKLRQMAEFDNYRRRTNKEKMDLLNTAGERIFTDMLPLIDDFERTKQAMQQYDDVASLREGVDLIYQKFMDFLAKNEVQPIETEGADFSTDEHEAITTFAAGEDKKGKIIDCTQKGYKLGDKVIRFAKVVVGE